MTSTQFVVFSTRRLAVFALATSMLTAASAMAQAPVPPLIVDSSGFEAPKFSTTFGPGGPGTGAGQLEGQTPSVFQGTWLRTKGPGLSTANVTANTLAIGGSGAQVVKVDKAANSDDRWGVPVSGYPSGRYICIDWDMRVQQSAGNSVTTFGPFFGMEAYDDDSASIGLLGSLGVDAANGEVLIQAAGTGFFTAPGPSVAFGSWHSYMVQLDYQLHTAQYFLDNVQIANIGFVDQNNVVGGLNEFTDANISALAAAGNPASLALTGTAYYDNFTVHDGPCEVPEPATIALGALAIMSLVAKRRTRQMA